MAFNGSGTFNLYTPGNPVVTGTTISSTWANNTLSDIATGLSGCITKDGQTTPTANIPMGSNRLTGLAAATSRTDAIQYAQVQDGSPTYLTSPSGTNTVTATAPNTMAAYSAGQAFKFIPANTNTGATTLNINSIGAKNVYLNNAALVGGELVQNVPVHVFYDGTQFQIVGPNAPASKTQQETGTQTNLYVSPGRQHSHKSAAKAWVSVNSSASIFDSYNVTSVTDTGTGQATVNFTTAFANTNYCTVQSCEGGSYITSCTSIGTGSILLRCFNDAGAFQDPSTHFAAFFGAQ